MINTPSMFVTFLFLLALFLFPVGFPIFVLIRDHKKTYKPKKDGLMGSAAATILLALFFVFLLYVSV